MKLLDIFKKKKQEHAHLIHNFNDEGAQDYIGIGVSFIRNNKRCRVAVRLENDFTTEELKAGIRKLARSMANPFSKDSGVLCEDNRCLTGREIKIRWHEK